jgi:ribosomal protein S18 acetylase RimI-like enzyme
MVELDRMTDAEFEVFVERAVPAYAVSKVRAGNWNADDALQRAAGEFQALLPLGLGTADHHLYTVREAIGSAGRVVGSLWLAEVPGARRTAYVYDIFIDEAFRGRGLGEATMGAAEAESLRLGVDELKLHVFADNTQARALYEKLGYQVTNLNLSKRLTRKPPGER